MFTRLSWLIAVSIAIAGCVSTPEAPKQPLKTTIQIDKGHGPSPELLRQRQNVCMKALKTRAPDAFEVTPRNQERSEEEMLTLVKEAQHRWGLVIKAPEDHLICDLVHDFFSIIRDLGTDLESADVEEADVWQMLERWAVAEASRTYHGAMVAYAFETGNCSWPADLPETTELLLSLGKADIAAIGHTPFDLQLLKKQRHLFRARCHFEKARLNGKNPPVCKDELTLMYAELENAEAGLDDIHVDKKDVQKLIDGFIKAHELRQ